MATSKNTEQPQKLREDFLMLFVRSLIEHSYKPGQKKDFPINELQRIQQIQKSQEKLSEKMPINLPQPIPQLSMQSMPPQLPQMPRPLNYQQASATPFSAMQPPKIAPQPTPSSGKSGSVNLGKVTSLLRDPSVFSVECPGPTKNVLVNRAGSIQTTPLTLTKEEINSIMENVSEKTRIPLMSGIFKAAYQDIIITAVVSDFVGTRFIIQKMMPFQKY